jgi:hypothetical protein
MFEALLDAIMPMSPYLMPSIWIGLGAYVVWYFASAKNCVPLTNQEARLLWKIHKQSTECNARKWQQIKRRGKIIGFKCGCGYKYIQKRPII